MKTLSRTTIRNASKQDLADFIANITRDIPNDSLTLAELRKKARECERKSSRWFGGTISFEEWANS